MSMMTVSPLPWLLSCSLQHSACPHPHPHPSPHTLPIPSKCLLPSSPFLSTQLPLAPCLEHVLSEIGHSEQQKSLGKVGSFLPQRKVPQGNELSLGLGAPPHPLGSSPGESGRLNSLRPPLSRALFLRVFTPLFSIS